MKMEFMRYMKCVGAFVYPKDTTRYSKRPYEGPEKAARGG
jgi:hypothetical protein